MRVTKRKYLGISAIELMVMLVLVGVGTTLAGPSFVSYLSTQRALSVMNTMYSDMRLAQSEAIKRQIPIYFSLSIAGSTWCYGLNDNTSCDCTTANNCQLGSVTKVVSSTSFTNVTVSSALSSNNMAFEGLNGTASATGTITITSGSHSNTITVNDQGLIATN